MQKSDINIQKKTSNITEETVSVQGYGRQEIIVRTKGMELLTYKLKVRGIVDGSSTDFHMEIPKDWLEELKIVIDEALKISKGKI